MLKRFLKTKTFWMALAVLCALPVFRIYFSDEIFFYKHKTDFQALAQDIISYKKINSLEVGDDYITHDKDGKIHRFDDYRFLNDTLVTHYADGEHIYPAYPDSRQQSEWFIDHYLKENGISKEAYFKIFNSLKSLNAGSISLDDKNHTVKINKKRSKGDPEIVFAYFWDGHVPDGMELQYINSIHSLGNNWYVVNVQLIE